MAQPKLSESAETQLSRHLRHDAQRIAELLRLTRITILWGSPGAGKTTLLKTGVLPLLRRRVLDQGPDAVGNAQLVVPFPDRRRGLQIEVAVFFDAWDAAPLTGLRERIVAALPRVPARAAVPSLRDTLLDWHRELNVRFFIVLDRFEEFLRAPADAPGILAFSEEIVRLLNEPAPANILISSRDDAESLLERFRTQIPGLGDATVRLNGLQRLGRHDAEPPPPPAPVHLAIARAEPKHTSPPPEKPITHWYPRIAEAQLVAELLRTSRLSVLYGNAGAGKSTLLRAGVLPLLRRRQRDCNFGHRSSAIATPFPDNRKDNRIERAAEVPLRFQSWIDDPLSALQKDILGALPSGLAPTAWSFGSLCNGLSALSNEFGLRFLIVFDHFEQYLSAPPERSGHIVFADQFAQAVNDSSLRANFLISVRNDAASMLERFRTQIRGFDDASFRLEPFNRFAARATELRVVERLEQTSVGDAPATGSPPSENSPHATAIEPFVPPGHSEAHTISFIASAPDISRDGEKGRHSVLTAAVSGQAAQEVSSAAPATHLEIAAQSSPSSEVAEPATEKSCEGTVEPSLPDKTKTNASGSADLKPAMQMDVVPASGLTGSPAVKLADAAAATAPSPTPITPVAASAAHRMRKKLLIGTMCAAPLIVAGSAFYRANEKLALPAAAVPARQPAASIASPVTLSKSNLPRIGFVTEPGNSTDASVASDMLRIVAPEARVELDMRSDGPFSQHEGMAGLAIMRYESLQAARMNRTQNVEKLDEVRVVAPLYTEEIHFIVRRDSPLTYIHELRGARLNLGPAQSSRALVVRRLHESMFAEPMETANSTFSSDNEALSALVTGKTIDAMVVVSAQPAKWLVDLPPHIARSLKLLRLDPTHSASAKAIEAYLPVMVRAANYNTWLTEDIPTLATIAFLVTLNHSEAPMVKRLEEFTSSLCRLLPVLRQNGHPKWREVQPDFEVDTGWPYSKAARAGFQSCVRGSAAGNPVVPIVDRQRR